jgi:DNA-binding CsgD family transcriptional regulator
MKAAVRLTPREAEVAELLAWGSAKKEVADWLCISTRTVENTTRNIYEKISIQKATELCVWWFCTHCGVSFDLSPIKRQLLSIALLLIILPQLANNDDDVVRTFRTSARSTSSRAQRSGRKNENDINLLEI